VSYFFHGATLALVWFLVTNIVLSVLVAVVAYATAHRAGPSSSLPLVLRLFPAVAAAAFVAGVVAPSYWRFEPRDLVEAPSVTLTLLAAGAALLLVGSCARGILAWRRVAGRARAWTATAEPIGVVGGTVPVFRIDAPQPVMALVGILRPRLLVTRGLIDALTPEELAASLAHEVGHQRAWDNLKRLAMLGAPDLLRWMPAARRLEQLWAASAEHCADAAAGDASGRTARLALASALVKVARLMPQDRRVLEPISTLVGGGEIAARVEHLIAGGAELPASRGQRAGRFAMRCTAALGVLIALAYVYAPLLATVHGATEILVHHLP